MGWRSGPSWAAQLGLEADLSPVLAQLFKRRPEHDPGRLLVDLAATPIDGRACVSDVGALADQSGLIGRDPTALDPLRRKRAQWESRRRRA